MASSSRPPLSSPRVTHCFIRDEYTLQPVMILEFAFLRNQQGPDIPPNQFEVQIAENEANATVPWTPFAVQRNFHSLMHRATDKAIWGGRMNANIPTLAAAQNVCADEASNAKVWTTLPSPSDNRDQFSFYRSVAAERFDIDCAPRSSSFGVRARQNIGGIGKPAVKLLDLPELVKALDKQLTKVMNTQSRLCMTCCAFYSRATTSIIAVPTQCAMDTSE